MTENCHTTPSGSAPASKGRRCRLVWSTLPPAGAAVGIAIFLSGASTPQRTPTTLDHLLNFTPAQLSQVPLVKMNILCAQSLSSANGPDLKQCASTVQQWATRVRSETHRHLYRYERNPAEFENSPGFFRMLMLAVVLAEDYGVHYDPQRRAGPGTTLANGGFFNDPRAVFLHGLLGPERSGTCSSLPVLYVAIGRELGYPLKLVTTKGHLFVRWEGQGERFNIEATGRGLNRFDDDYYRHWPFEITAAEEQAEGYLKSLTPAEELAAFLSIRGMCLQETGRVGEAAQAFAAAARLAPGCESYRKVLTSLQPTVGRYSRSKNSPQKRSNWNL